MKAKDTILKVLGENVVLRATMLVLCGGVGVLAAATWLLASRSGRPVVWTVYEDRIEQGGRVVYEWQPREVARNAIEAVYVAKKENREEILRALLEPSLAKRVLDAQTTPWEAVAFRRLEVLPTTASVRGLTVQADVALVPASSDGRSPLFGQIALTLEPSADRSALNPIGLWVVAASSTWTSER